MFTGSCHTRQPQHFWFTLLAIVALVGALFGILSAQAEPAHAAGLGGTPRFPTVDQVKANPATFHPTPTQAAYAADKVRLSNEYDHLVLTGKEPLATFEAHYRAFMVKWNLGGVANLNTALTQATARLRSSTARAISPLCIVQPGGGCVYPVYQAQFPEENWNWCGPATLSTTLIEDSFAWPGANTYGAETLTRDQFVVSQPYSNAYNDEYWMATNGIFPDGNILSDGTTLDLMDTMVNEFVNGHGGNYAEEPITGTQAQQIADFQGKVESDIGTGWDVPTAIDVPANNGPSLPGYPSDNSEINHWLPVTQISSDGNTTYYSDPIYGAPAYPPSDGWNIPAPYESTSTTNLVWYTNWILW